ncbi:hypothetical protein [Bosea sp. FBZP-16]|uniref:hypothetical protein n=1 Tax=Bosea sp. FBZP-16 TaxID=2065382 RepID=UPI000C3148E4|nr:hypothetical protein [Bosea sp. FBZP-16]
MTSGSAGDKPERVWGFYYGGLINPKVMQQLGMAPAAQDVAMLPGYELQISPLMNLVRNDRQAAYGLLLLLTHDEIEHVYGQLKAKYYPYPVLARDREGRERAALCYLLPKLEPGQAEAQYVTNLLEPATALGFPGWYLDRIRSFLPR